MLAAADRWAGFAIDGGRVRRISSAPATFSAAEPAGALPGAAFPAFAAILSVFAGGSGTAGAAHCPSRSTSFHARSNAGAAGSTPSRAAHAAAVLLTGMLGDEGFPTRWATREKLSHARRKAVHIVLIQLGPACRLSFSPLGPDLAIGQTFLLGLLNCLLFDQQYCGAYLGYSADGIHWARETEPCWRTLVDAAGWGDDTLMSLIYDSLKERWVIYRRVNPQESERLVAEDDLKELVKRLLKVERLIAPLHPPADRDAVKEALADEGPARAFLGALVDLLSVPSPARARRCWTAPSRPDRS